MTARHDAVFEEYGAHLIDNMAALEQPALNDPSVAATERFDRARIYSDEGRLTVRHGAQELVASYGGWRPGDPPCHRDVLCQ
ncbi:hypothetical protein [Streptomyces sp. NPDC056056]|uniref:hypothetical protein n=1 Tax=Streptomyces sp. NPDC056056 TaxID=3345698 RepID=UPI0035D8EB24